MPHFGPEIDAYSPYQPQTTCEASAKPGLIAVRDLLNATYGNGHAMARWLGIMFLIWNNRIWESYRPILGWQAYSGDRPHQDHIHISFSWPGANKQTTWYTAGQAAVDGSPAAVSMRDGHQEVFTRGANGSVWHKRSRARPPRRGAQRARPGWT